ncbi:uncharacterized protein DUF2789 [Comamonas sp. BIGb0124]|uniref:DUF2789 family protein n=1 Tax=Comamonas sp. BIGb0124 TaxID=2485130 RepID=UPI000F4781C9|nr:DUF2789 family protein [Comamonas sp. BIGb0124]ROR23142.1 uncharacterized protein DUF2789 [Comamonas sp. BIGb0124]
MNSADPTMTNLFLQLGLDAEPETIAEFIQSHQLPADTLIADASFWSDAQRQFIAEQIKADAPWALIVDQLNEALHADAVAASQS